MLPFDIALLRGVAYQTDASGNPVNPETHIGTIATYLRSARQDHHIDSPVFQFVDYAQALEVDHAKTDLFRKQVDYSREYKSKLGLARKEGLDAIRAVAADPALENLLDVEAGIVIDLFLSYRAVKAHQDMVDLYARMPQPLQRTRMVREQLAFALNRLGRADDAEKMLIEVIDKLGPSSETNGLLGRVYKDRWEAALKDGDEFTAAGLLDRAVETYRKGFEADWRDPYPGINAVTLMELQDTPDPVQGDLLPVVRYAALQRCQGSGDYWDYATLIELAVLARNVEEARKQTGKALALVREVWEPETTARNLRLIRETRERRGEDAAWIAQIEAGLKRAQDKSRGRRRRRRRCRGNESPLAPPLPACGERSAAERSFVARGGRFGPPCPVERGPSPALLRAKRARKSTSPRTRGEVGDSRHASFPSKE